PTLFRSSCAQVNERLFGCGGGSAEVFDGSPAIIGCLTTLVSATACQIRNVNRDLDFQDIHSVARLGEFFREGGDIFWLETGKFQALLAVAIIVSQRLQEERSVQRDALGSHSLDKGKFHRVDALIVARP